MIGASVRKAMLQGQRQVSLKVPVRTIYPQMSSNVISGMPRVRIPFAEKVATGVFLGFCILATPAWITTHMDDYRGGPVGQA